MRTVVAALLFMVLSMPSAARADSLRCGQALVTEGDSKSEVLAKCGEPASKETRVVYETVKFKSSGGGDAVVQEQTVQKTIDEWTYDFGRNNFIQFVIFENGKLVSVRSGGYGN
jgi:Protein of unknown function (DUF2845)